MHSQEKNINIFRPTDVNIRLRTIMDNQIELLWVDSQFVLTRNRLQLLAYALYTNFP